jgi:hypothetical protein
VSNLGWVDLGQGLDLSDGAPYPRGPARGFIISRDGKPARPLGPKFLPQSLPCEECQLRPRNHREHVQHLSLRPIFTSGILFSSPPPLPTCIG